MDRPPSSPNDITVEPDEDDLGGSIYDVKEFGTNIRHRPSAPTPADGAAFLKQLKSHFSIRIMEHSDPNELVFEMNHVDVSFANALRRIMIAEVPTMAIETVYIWNNTSIVHDEVLSHRLGLVPLAVDPRCFRFLDEEDDDEIYNPEEGHEPDEDGPVGEANDRNTLVFRMDVKCKKEKSPKIRHGLSKVTEDERSSETINADSKADTVGGDATIDGLAAAQASNSTHEDVAYQPLQTRSVYSRDLQWVPQGIQSEQFAESGGIHPIHPDILLAKLRPGQAILLDAHARKGIGADHAKFSPVATACYRNTPRVVLKEEVYDDLAEELEVYEPGVFRLINLKPSDKAYQAGHRVRAVVDNPYACTMSRNFYRNPDLAEKVEITRIPDRFVFSIESVGMIPAAVVLTEALRVLRDKCYRLVRQIDFHYRQTHGGMEGLPLRNGLTLEGDEGGPVVVEEGDDDGGSGLPHGHANTYTSMEGDDELEEVSE